MALGHASLLGTAAPAALPNVPTIAAMIMAYGTVGGHDILTIANGDPGLPFVTLIDVTDLVNRKFTPPFTTPGQGHCLPVNYPAYPTNGVAANNYTPTNPAACILGQIYYDAANTQSSTVPVDTTGAGMPGSIHLCALRRFRRAISFGSDSRNVNYTVPSLRDS